MRREGLAKATNSKNKLTSSLASGLASGLASEKRGEIKNWGNFLSRRASNLVPSSRDRALGLRGAASAAVRKS